MSKLSEFIHAHAGVFKVGTEVLGLAISELPIPEAAKLPLMGVVVEMNKTANNMGDNANTVAQNLLSELSGGISETAQTVTNPKLQQGLSLVGQLSSSAAAILSSNGGQPAGNVTVPNAPDAPLPSSAPSVVVQPATPVAPAPVVAATPAPAAPDPVVVTPAAPAADPLPDSTTAAALAPATQVTLGLAVDPNAAHVSTDPDGVTHVTNQAPVTDVAPTDPGLAVAPAGADLSTLEQALNDAVASGDRGRIAAASQALADAAKVPQA